MRAAAPLLALTIAHGIAAAAGYPGKEQVPLQCTRPEPNDCGVRLFKDAPEGSRDRGRAVFRDRCTLCHGSEGRGDGRAARLHTPRPADLVASRAPPEYLSLIIRRGGEAIGRGKGMPPWDEELTDEQTRDVISHLLSIRR